MPALTGMALHRLVGCKAGDTCAKLRHATDVHYNIFMECSAGRLGKAVVGRIPCAIVSG